MAKADAIGGMYMGMNWADNAYYLPNYKASAKMCFTNTPARTSMRAPGVVQTCFATEVRKHISCGVICVYLSRITSCGCYTYSGMTKR